MNMMKQLREWQDSLRGTYDRERFVVIAAGFVISVFMCIALLIAVTSTMALVREHRIKAAIMQTGLQARCDTSTYIGEKAGTGEAAAESATPPTVMLSMNAVNSNRLRAGYVFVTGPRLERGLDVGAYCNIAPLAVCSEPRARVEYVFDTTYTRADTLYVITHRSFSLLKKFKGRWIPAM